MSSLTPGQVERGQKAVANLRALFNYATTRFTALVGFYRYLSSRHRAVIYFMAGLKKDRHGVKYEDLNDDEIKAVDNAIEELASIIEAYRQATRKYHDP